MRHHDGHGHGDHEHDTGAPQGAAAIAHAEAVCAERGQRLTDMRRLVLQGLVESRKALGAYDLIDIVAAQGVKRPAPVAIYRALDFLIETGLAHRIESRNAFVACPHSHHGDEVSIFFICDNCLKVVEETSQSIRAGLSLLARKRGFEVRSNVMEVEGRCSSCRYTPMTA